MKQIIISVGREFGSGGHIVAQKLAEHYDIPIFNKELLEEMARKEGYGEKALEKYDEKPVNFGFMPLDRKSTRLNSSHWNKSRMPSSA